MSISFIGDGTLDDDDREILRQAFASYSRQERVGLRRFIDLQLSQRFMRKERTLRLMLHVLDGAPVRRQGGNLRSVPPVLDGSPDG